MIAARPPIEAGGSSTDAHSSPGSMSTSGRAHGSGFLSTQTTPVAKVYRSALCPSGSPIGLSLLELVNEKRRRRRYRRPRLDSARRSKSQKINRVNTHGLRRLHAGDS